MEQNQVEVSWDDLVIESVDEIEEQIETTEEAPKQTEEEQLNEVKEEENSTEEQSEQTQEKEEPVQTETTSSPYNAIVKDLLEEGDWEDVEVESKDGEFVKLSELVTKGEVDKDTYLLIKKDNDKTKEEDLKSNFISVKDLDETQKTLLNIVKNGNYEEAKKLFENPENLKEPFQGFDSDNIGHNKQVYAHYLGSMGHGEDEIALLIEKASKDLTLADKAEKIVEHHRAKHKESLKLKEEAILKEVEEEKKRTKEFKKTLSDQYKTNGIDDKISKRLIETATKEEKDGGLRIHSLYEAALEDPKRAADVIFFLTEPEKFLQHKMAETKRSTLTNEMRKIRRLQQDKASKQGTAQQEETISKTTDPFSNLQVE